MNPLVTPALEVLEDLAQAAGPFTEAGVLAAAARRGHPARAYAFGPLRVVGIGHNGVGIATQGLDGPFRTGVMIESAIPFAEADRRGLVRLAFRIIFPRNARDPEIRKRIVSRAHRCWRIVRTFPDGAVAEVCPWCLDTRYVEGGPKSVRAAVGSR